jgi:signal transduction histidine kinase
MKGLVDSLLVLAKADAGRLTLERHPLDLAQLVQECVSMVTPLAAERGIAIETHLKDVEISADASRIAQVVTNLLTNAIRYNRDNGRVKVGVEVSGDAATLEVADTGIGIPWESQPHIFERFYRVDSARSREQGGSGLGLAICKSIIEAHGGTLSFQSQEGEGSTFIVRLPRIAPAAANTVPAK